MSVHADTANLLELICNQEGRHLDEHTLVELTPGHSLAERAAVVAELAPWAQRAVRADSRAAA